MFQEICKKQGSFSLWKNVAFWLKWFELDLKEQLDKNKFKDNEEYYFNLLIVISSLMQQLNIELKFILQCIFENISHKYIKNVNLK